MTTIKTWDARMQDYYGQGGSAPIRTTEYFKDLELAELRAALAAAASPHQAQQGDAKERAADEPMFNAFDEFNSAAKAIQCAQPSGMTERAASLEAARRKFEKLFIDAAMLAARREG